MQTLSTKTEKEKIDPAIDKPVKFYLDILTRMEKSADEGLVLFPNDLMELIMNKCGGPDVYHAYHEDLGSHEDLLTCLKTIGAMYIDDINLLLRAVNSLGKPNEIRIICFKLIEALPEDNSRLFYTKQLESFQDDPEVDGYDNTVEKNTLNLFSIIFSLFIRSFFQKFIDAKNNMVNEDVVLLKDFDATGSVLSVMLTIFSHIANQVAVTELKTTIPRGDDTSLFSAIAIDKSLLYTDDVKKRVITAQLSGEIDFFSKLGKAMARNPLKRMEQHRKTYSVLKTFWLTGLYRLTNMELYDFLTSCGLTPPPYPGAFQKFVRRHIRSVYNF